MKRKDLIGKIKFLYINEKKRLENKPVLKGPLKDWSTPSGFIQANYLVSNNSSYLSVLRSDINDLPNWINVDEYCIVNNNQYSNKYLLCGPNKTMNYHQTTPEKLKKVNPLIIISA